MALYHATITDNKIIFLAVCLSGSIKLTGKITFEFSPLYPINVDCWVGLLRQASLKTC